MQQLSIESWLKVNLPSYTNDAEIDILIDFILTLHRSFAEKTSNELIQTLSDQLRDYIQNSEQFAKDFCSYVVSNNQLANFELNLLNHSDNLYSKSIEKVDMNKIDKIDKNSKNSKQHKNNNKRNKYKNKYKYKNKNQKKICLKNNNYHHTPKRNLLRLISFNQDNDKGNKIIVANVPQNKLHDEIKLKEYFSVFGHIKQLSVNYFLRVIEIEFFDSNSANLAWRSSIPIFDNRLIKVYYAKTLKSVDNKEKKQEEKEEREEREERENDDKLTTAKNEPIDTESIERIQSQKQIEFLDKKLKQKQFERKVFDLIDKKESLVKEISLKLKLLNNQVNEIIAREGDKGEELPVVKKLKYQISFLNEQSSKIGLTPGVFYEEKKRLFDSLDLTLGRNSSVNKQFEINKNKYNLDNRPKKLLISSKNTIDEKFFKDHLRNGKYGIVDLSDRASDRNDKNKDNEFNKCITLTFENYDFAMGFLNSVGFKSEIEASGYLADLC
ncbi:uncharacterized protein ASCRUDRAFT_78721 [Ascoidea rubescens DSM 1968]|uniref:RRM domain-containing protein n=1 Tax=Ascoidea rubescens DSM 1968 TaxID=1344418 RepID=A0A1D2VPY5_9ASCO|nr:hypothetical protein ASCRUDRAFT_78721 [Ascoidea rubescens DSM 1968]ODV63668.1 hypothetical protein ASCRUDRAFT_78721 [Ascoidea rubescens DSM 1968]